MNCILIETSAYADLQVHIQRLLERVSTLQALTEKSPTVCWLTTDDVCKALSITKLRCNITGLAVSYPTQPSETKSYSGKRMSVVFWKRT